MLLESNQIKLDSKVIPFNLKGIEGKNYSLESFSEKDILVVIFMCNHCPYVIAIIERLVNFQKKYENKNVQLIGISSNDVISYPEDSFENMKIFSRDFKMNFPYLFDETQETAKKYDAVCTPDIYVYDNERKLKYRGRFDDNWKDASMVKSNDLENTVNLLLENKEINFKQIPSMGCSIKWKQ